MLAGAYAYIEAGGHGGPSICIRGEVDVYVSERQVGKRICMREGIRGGHARRHARRHASHYLSPLIIRVMRTASSAHTSLKPGSKECD